MTSLCAPKPPLMWAAANMSPACRPGSHDLKFADGDWSYLDSYFGGRDFIGEEVVYYQGQPVWAENYYGRILRPDLITPAQAGQVIKASLSKMYSEGRFLGGFEYRHEGFIYTDTSEGEVNFLPRPGIYLPPGRDRL